MKLPDYVKNKSAQVFALTFSRDYLCQWPNFVQDIILTTLGSENQLTEFGTSMYLRILLAIDAEVDDRMIDYSVEVRDTENLFYILLVNRLLQTKYNAFTFALKRQPRWFWTNVKTRLCWARCVHLRRGYITEPKWNDGTMESKKQNATSSHRTRFLIAWPTAI